MLKSKEGLWEIKIVRQRKIENREQREEKQEGYWVRKETEEERKNFGREKDEDTSICSWGEDESQRGFSGAVR